MLTKIQNQLIKQHPELQEKKQIFEFYVSLESPEKQRKLMNWWQEMIENAIRKSEDIYLTPADLEFIFTLHGLKPVPLEKILDHLAKTNRIQWEGRAQQAKENSKGWLGSIMSVVWRPKANEAVKSGFKSMAAQQSQKIISTSYKKQIIAKIKTAISQQTLQDNAISFDFILNKLKKQVPISVNSIQYLLAELDKQGWMIIDFVQEKKIIIQSNEEREIKNQLWVEVQKSKFLLKSTIEQFDRRISGRLKEEEGKLFEAKKYVESDQTRAKKILREVREMKKVTEEFENRRRLLRQTLDRLQIQMINSATVNLMSECQKIVQKTMIDESQLEAIKEKHIEFAIHQKTVDNELNAMNTSQLGEQVDLMMAELEKQIKEEKKTELGSKKEKEIKLPQFQTTD